MPSGGPNRWEDMSRFALHCGVLVAILFELWIICFVTKHVADNELAKADQLPTPFAYAVLGLNSLSLVAVLLALTVVPFSGLTVGFCLPPSESLWKRVIATAQGGATAAAIGLIFSTQLAISLGLCTVPSLPLFPPSPDDWLTNRSIMAGARWLRLAGINLGFYVGIIILFSLLWAFEGWITAAVRGLFSNPPCQLSPTKSPPHVPNA